MGWGGVGVRQRKKENKNPQKKFLETKANKLDAAHVIDACLLIVISVPKLLYYFYPTRHTPCLIGMLRISDIPVFQA